MASFPKNSSPDLYLVYGLPVLDSMAPPSLEPPTGPNLHYSTKVSTHSPYLIDYHCSFAFVTLFKPHTYHEAHIDPICQKAMYDELDALHKNHTWDIVDLPSSQSIVDCKWVHKIKTKADGSVE